MITCNVRVDKCNGRSDTRNMTNAKYEIVTMGRNHYVTHIISREFNPPVPFTSKRKAQAVCDEKNRG